MAGVNHNIGSSLLNFKFTDGDDVIASFRMNPMDVKLAKRCEEAADFFTEVEKKLPENATLDDAIGYNDEIESKICYLLGYDAKQSLFGLISATSIMEDGRMFCIHVMEHINQAVAKVLSERKAKMKKAAERHTASYK